MAKDKELADHERAHTGKPGSKVRHGADATGVVKRKPKMSTEDKIYDEQHKMITDKYGKDVADKANYGWGVSEDDGRLSVATKVYHPKGAKVLTSNSEHPDLPFDHNWEKY